MNEQELKGALYAIANYLTTSRDYKGHGYWMNYVDDKIGISYDTYFPNFYVEINLEGKWECVFFSGHTVQTYHPGKWEAYVEETLLPRAKSARAIIDKEEKEKMIAESKKNFCMIDDSKIF
jgi:hypothetical protein